MSGRPALPRRIEQTRLAVKRLGQLAGRPKPKPEPKR